MARTYSGWNLVLLMDDGVFVGLESGIGIEGGEMRRSEKREGKVTLQGSEDMGRLPLRVRGRRTLDSTRHVRNRDEEEEEEEGYREKKKKIKGF